MFGHNRETASIALRNGDRLTATLLMDTVELTTVFGKIQIGMEHVITMAVPASGAAGSDLLLWYSFDVAEERQITDESGNRHHVAVVGEDGQIVLYKDGIEVSRREFREYTHLDDGEICIGRSHGPSHKHWFKGALDDIRVYGRPLSKSEIRGLAA